MGYARAHGVALRGAVGHLVDVQADVSPGLVGVTLVGRADSVLAEGRDRVRMAIINSDLEWPATKRITVLLSPADLPKGGSHYDLAMALAILAASGELETIGLERTVFIGELALDGGLRPTSGVLPMVLAASHAGIARVVVPEPQVAEARMVPGMEILGFRSLGQVVAELRGEPVPDAPPVATGTGGSLLGWRGDRRLDDMDMSDLRGMPETRYAVEVAAAGGHHLLLKGPKGCGKTSIAERIPTILPDLSREESLEVMAVQSLAGVLDVDRGLLTRPPFAAPHHDASKPGIVGGGTGRVRPGQVSLSHAGVLFLDEFPLFKSDVIECLREPLESGDITVSRGEESVTLPARALVVLAANPCPCGNFDASITKDGCICRSNERQAYERKVSGPITDRIDIIRTLRPMSEQNHDPWGSETSADIRERVTAARHRQRERYADFGWRLNGQASGIALRDNWPLPPSAEALIDSRIFSGALTRRGAVRVHRLAWTVADLAGVDWPGVKETETALALRNGGSLTVSTFEGRSA